MQYLELTGFFAGGPGGFEILLILVVMLLLFGAKNLPQIARTIGKTMEQFQRAAREVREEVVRAGVEPDEQEVPKVLPGQVARGGNPEQDEEPPSTPATEDKGDEQA